MSDSDNFEELLGILRRFGVSEYTNGALSVKFGILGPISPDLGDSGSETKSAFRKREKREYYELLLGREIEEEELVRLPERLQ